VVDGVPRGAARVRSVIAIARRHPRRSSFGLSAYKTRVGRVLQSLILLAGARCSFCVGHAIS